MSKITVTPEEVAQLKLEHEYAQLIELKRAKIRRELANECMETATDTIHSVPAIGSLITSQVSFIGAKIREMGATHRRESTLNRRAQLLKELEALNV